MVSTEKSVKKVVAKDARMENAKFLGNVIAFLKNITKMIVVLHAKKNQGGVIAQNVRKMEVSARNVKIICFSEVLVVKSAHLIALQFKVKKEALVIQRQGNATMGVRRTISSGQTVTKIVPK